MTAAIHNEATRRLGIGHPIVQGPFGGGLSTAQLAATVSNLGGLGSFGAYQLAPERIGAIAAEIRALTRAPFALNLWVSDHDVGGDVIPAHEFAHAWCLFEPFFHELGVAKPEPPEHFHPRFELQIEALLEAAPPVFSFVFGIPSKQVLAQCRRPPMAPVPCCTCAPG